MNPRLASIGRDAVTFFFGSFRRIASTSAVLLVILFVVYQPFNQFVLGGLFDLLTIAIGLLVLSIIAISFGYNPKRLFQKKKSH